MVNGRLVTTGQQSCYSKLVSEMKFPAYLAVHGKNIMFDTAYSNGKHS